MSTSSQQPGPKIDVVTQKTDSSGWVTTSVWTIAIIPAIFALVFHAGAAYISYQRNQSIGWAIVHFLLAVFYYPYYAFTQAGKPVESATPSLMPAVQTAGRKLMKALKRK